MSLNGLAKAISLAEHGIEGKFLAQTGDFQDISGQKGQSVAFVRVRIDLSKPFCGFQADM